VLYKSSHITIVMSAVDWIRKRESKSGFPFHQETGKEAER
jgi:hypothetical protein